MADDTTYCPYCGASMNAGATFCPSCGAQIGAPAGAAQAGAAPAPGAAYGQQYNGNAKPESGAKTIGIISIVLAVLGIIIAISYFACMGSIDSIYDSIKADVGDMTVDQTKSMINGILIYLGVTTLILAIAGFVGGICAVKGTNYGLGLAMFIIALVMNVITLGAGTFVGLIIAIVFLVVYVKAKPTFS